LAAVSVSDPDPAFKAEYLSGYRSGSRVLMTKIGKNLPLIRGLNEGRQNFRRSLQPLKENIQNF
jgi:hypothetical protein